MNVKILLIAIASISLGSCSTAYKSGQTPDDVYFSPVKVVEENNDDEDDRNYDVTDAEEREIRMASRDRRWRDWDDDYDCRYDPYRYGYSYGYYYNPYYYPYPVYSGYVFVNPKNTTPRMTNLGGYNPKTLVVSNPKTGETRWINSPKIYNNSNNSSSRNSGGFVRRVLSGNSDNNNNSSSNNSNRSYTPSSNSSNSGSSSGTRSSSGTSVSRPSRGN